MNFDTQISLVNNEPQAHILNLRLCGILTRVRGKVNVDASLAYASGYQQGTTRLKAQLPKTHDGFLGALNKRLVTGMSCSIRLALFLFSVLLCVLPSANCVAQDVGQKAFEKKKFPWYDAANDGVKRIDLGTRPGISSEDRNSIQLKPIKQVNPNANRFTPAGAGAFLEGLGIVAWILIALVIIAAGAALLWAFLRMNDNRDSADEQEGPRRSMADSIKQLPFELEVESGDFRQAAQKAYAANDYRNAVVFLFSHVLVSLDQRNLIRLRKGKTNRQYLTELRPFRPLSDFYQRVMVPFESTFFGDHDIGKQEFENCWAQLDKFQRDVEQTTQVSNV